MDNAHDSHLTLREVQLASLAILKAIDEICQELGLRYWLTYGTLIGAIRHGGFIPWDDDVDICMPRSDYDKFVAYFGEHRHELAPLLCLDGFSEARSFLITRITDTRYQMVGENALDNPELGTFVDVYPLDGLGDDCMQAQQTKRRCGKLYRQYVKAYNSTYGNINSGGFKRLLKRARAMLLGDKKRYLDELKTELAKNSFDSSLFVACAQWEITPVVYRRAIFDGMDRVLFEDFLAPIPTGYDELLNVLYGDYTTLPPLEQRVAHHEYQIVPRNGQSIIFDKHLKN